MKCEDLLRELAAVDIHLSIIDEKKIHIDAPEGRLTNELKAILKEYKPQLLAHLAKTAETEADIAELQESRERLAAQQVSVAVWPDGEMKIVTGIAVSQAWSDGGMVFDPGEMFAYIQLNPAERRLFRDLKGLRQR